MILLLTLLLAGRTHTAEAAETLRHVIAIDPGAQTVTVRDLAETRRQMYEIAAPLYIGYGLFGPGGVRAYILP